MVTLDGREVNVGDKLWDFKYGWGVVKGVYISSRIPINIYFESLAIHLDFSNCGKHSSDMNRTLFWNEIQVTPPNPPKKLVKKWRWVLQHKYNENTFEVSGGFYTEEEAIEFFQPYKAIQKIDSTMIEVEED